MKYFSDFERARKIVNGSRLKGRTKIILTDARTGREIVEQDENMITNAVQGIFAANFNGAGSFWDFMPTYKNMLGVLCFRDPMTESAGNIFPANQDINPMVANAGPDPHTSASTTRGNPVGQPEIVNNSIKFTWLWDLTQGNGQISTVCLTSGAAGNSGLMPDGTGAFLQATGLAVNGYNQTSGSDLGATLNRARALKMPMSIKTNGDGLAVWLDGDTFEEITVRHGFVRAELLAGIQLMPDSDYKEVSNRTATLSRSYDRGYAQIGQDDNFYYVFQRDGSSANVLYCEKIAKTDFSVTSSTLTLSGVTLANTFSPNNTQSQGTLLYNAIISNGFLYWVSGDDNKTFVKIEISTPANVSVLDSNMSAVIQADQMPIVINNGFVIGRNFVINGSRVYPITAHGNRAYLGGGNGPIGSETMAPYNGGPVFYQSTYYRHANTYDYFSTGGVIALPYLATINNLQNAVTKSNIQTMRVEYTLTET